MRERMLMIAAGAVGFLSLVMFELGESQRGTAEVANSLAGRPSEVAMQSWTVVGWVLVGLAGLLLLAGLIGWAVHRD